MKSRYAFPLMIAVAAAVFAASTWAQDDRPRRDDLDRPRRDDLDRPRRDDLDRPRRDDLRADPLSADSAPTIRLDRPTIRLDRPTIRPDRQDEGPSDLRPDADPLLSPRVGPAGRRATRDQPGTREAELERRVDDLSRELGSTESDQRRREIRATLGEILGKQFDLRQKRHIDEIERLEPRIKKLRQLVQKRQESRTEIIAHRLDQIVRDSQGLGF
jgi:hypothetical protein